MRKEHENRVLAAIENHQASYIVHGRDNHPLLTQYNIAPQRSNIDNRASSVLRHLPEAEFDPRPDCEICKMILRNNADQTRRHRAVFLASRIYRGRLRVPDWAVTLATDKRGYRYISNDTLDGTTERSLGGAHVLLETTKGDSEVGSMAWRSS